MALTVDCDIPAGNIVVENIEGDTVYARPDLRDTEGHWFYWCFRARGAGGRTLRCRLTSPNTLTEMGPAVSTDRGWTWSWAGPEAMSGWSFEYCVPAEADDVRFSMGMPYTDRNLAAFLERHGDTPHLESGELCRSRKGRPVRRLNFGCLDAEPAHRVLVTARHHCCEMMAGYALEGLVLGVLADDQVGRWMRRNVEFLAVPMVDTDGVEEGDQGKNRRPHDHGRDYGERSIYPETGAIRALVPQWSAGRLRVGLDLHCPWIRGEWNDIVYQVGARAEEAWREQQRFGNMLEQENAGPLPYRVADNLPFGEAWNTGSNYKEGRPFRPWLAEQPDVRLATSFEIPYAVAGGVEVNQQTARAFGRNLARALHRYLIETA